MSRRRFASPAAFILAAVVSLSLVALFAHASDAQAPPKPPKPPSSTPTAPPPPPGAPGAYPSAGAPQPPTGPPPPAPKPPTAADKAEAYYKNIQAFKGVPADQLIPAMQFMSASLGVDCDFCHVEHAPEKDDKEEKMTARDMIKMTAAVNRDNFEGHKEVTCFSCHRGASHPLAVPAVATSDEQGEEHEAPPQPPAARPSVDAVLEKYLAAVGGAPALEKVSSRVMKGTIGGLGPRPMPLEIFAKAPDKRLSTVKTPFGDNISAFSGKTGWVAGPGRPVQDMTAAEAQAARIDAAIRLPLQLKQMFEDVRVARPDKIGDKQAVRVVGRSEGKTPVEFWFDGDSGLLLRTVRFEETPLGRNPTQTDFSDFRVVEGVKIPYQWIIARPGRRFTVKIDDVKPNAPVDDTKFAKPDAS